MSIADDKRAEILERLADHMLAQGLAGSSLRPLAAAAGTSDRMLLYYFKDKAELTAAVLARVAARLAAALDAGTDGTPAPVEALRERLLAQMRSPALWPYMRLWLEIAAAAARGDAVCREVGAAIGRGFLAWGAARLDSPTPQAREREAAALIVSLEGLVVLTSLGLEDVGAQAYPAEAD